MRMAKRQNSRRAGFEKCPIPWKELMLITCKCNENYLGNALNVYMFSDSSDN